MRPILAGVLILASTVDAAARAAAGDVPWPTLDEAIASRRDAWGEAALRRPGGPDFESFARLLPPLRYVNAAFRHYPIVLSAPMAPVKARLVSNGSAINARAAAKTWREAGVPVSFRVGGEPFGDDLARLDGPRYADRDAPIVATTYRRDEADYSQESFAAVEPAPARRGTVFVRFGLRRGRSGTVAALVDATPAPAASGGVLRDAEGRAIACFDGSWIWDATSRTLSASLAPDRPATLALFTEPIPAAEAPEPITDAAYDRHRLAAGSAWGRLIGRGMRIIVPEPVVNDAWRATLAGIFALADGDRPNYGAGNAYQALYVAESGDAVRALLLFGHAEASAPLIATLLDYKSKGLGSHNDAFRLQLLAHHYWLTRDAAFLRAQRPRWQPAVDRLLTLRDPSTGLLPRERYCGDIATPVLSLNSCSNAWRGLRDVAAILADSGEPGESARVAGGAEALRRSTLAAVAKAERLDFDPPFIPIALSGEERPYEALTDSKLGSYWALMAPYVLGSGLLDGTPRERAILDTLHRRGGLFLGMIRFDQHSGLFANEDAVDDLYTLRYIQTILRRDDEDLDRALVSFYGKLAQGLTPGTFIGGEGTGLRPLDPRGRPMYLPPNASGNASFLWTLRSLLVQDGDLDADAVPETLRLLFATPPRWLADGAEVRVERAPTSFGLVSVAVTSHLNRGEVVAVVDAPPLAPKRMLLRLRLPDGWKALSARVGDDPLAVDPRGTVDLSGRKGKLTIRARVGR